MKQALPLILVSALTAPLFAQQSHFDPAATPPSWQNATRTATDYEPQQRPEAAGVRVTVIESTSANGGHVQDGTWMSVAGSEGFTATLSGQATLSSTAFYATTDILVVSSGVIAISPTAVANIQGFLAQGGSVYLQGEYLPTYSTNGAFATIVNGDGGGFTLGGTVSGDLQPMAVSGVLSNTPYTTGSLTYHWYGCNGTSGAGVTPFMHFGGNDFGWMYTTSSGTRIVHNTDQDWIRVANNNNLVANILYYLCGAGLNLAANNMVAGQVATLNVTGATPGGGVLLAYSLTGGGPTVTPYGPAALSQPIKQLPSQNADGAGNASYSQMLPAGAVGLAVWLQAYDLTAAVFSNGVATTIQ